MLTRNPNIKYCSFSYLITPVLMVGNDLDINTIATNLTLHRHRDEQRQQQGDKTSFLHDLWSLARCIFYHVAKLALFFEIAQYYFNKLAYFQP